MKDFGFLSFGHWTPSPQSQTRSAAGALTRTIELAVADEVREPGIHNLGAADYGFRARRTTRRTRT